MRRDCVVDCSEPGHHLPSIPPIHKTREGYCVVDCSEPGHHLPSITTKHGAGLRDQEWPAGMSEFWFQKKQFVYHRYRLFQYFIIVDAHFLDERKMWILHLDTNTEHTARETFGGVCTRVFFFGNLQNNNMFDSYICLHVSVDKDLQLHPPLRCQAWRPWTPGSPIPYARRSAAVLRSGLCVAMYVFVPM